MKILIVDDEKTVRRALGFALRKAGYETIEARNYAEALELINIHNFDLLIVDYNLPVISGFEFLEMLKRDGLKISSLIMSSNNDILKNQKNGYPLISKDLPVEKILIQIEKMLSQPKTNQRR